MKRIRRSTERIQGDAVLFDVSTNAHPDTWAVVDLDVWPLVRGIRWSATKRANGLYVRGHIGGKQVLLHRHIIGAPDDLTVDHKNGQPLDNRKANLRPGTQAQNNVWGADRRRGHAIERPEVSTAPHIVKRRLADGSVREYAYPTRSKTGTKRLTIRKTLPQEQNGPDASSLLDAAKCL